jgi:hypothetical protein
MGVRTRPVNSEELNVPMGVRVRPVNPEELNQLNTTRTLLVEGAEQLCLLKLFVWMHFF